MDNPVRKLIDYADALCDAILDTPASCEACPLYDYDKADEEEGFICPMGQLIDFLNEREETK